MFTCLSKSPRIHPPVDSCWPGPDVDDYVPVPGGRASAAPWQVTSLTWVTREEVLASPGGSHPLGGCQLQNWLLQRRSKPGAWLPRPDSLLAPHQVAGGRGPLNSSGIVQSLRLITVHIVIVIIETMPWRSIMIIFFKGFLSSIILIVKSITCEASGRNSPWKYKKSHLCCQKVWHNLPYFLFSSSPIVIIDIVTGSVSNCWWLLTGPPRYDHNAPVAGPDPAHTGTTGTTSR